jgi:hypothetical protein
MDRTFNLINRSIKPFIALALCLNFTMLQP